MTKVDTDTNALKPTNSRGEPITGLKSAARIIDELLTTTAQYIVPLDYRGYLRQLVEAALARPEQQNTDSNAVTAEMIEAGCKADDVDYPIPGGIGEQKLRVRAIIEAALASHPTKAPSEGAGQ